MPNDAPVSKTTEGEASFDAALEARRDAMLQEIGAEAGFDPAEDHAALIVRLFEATQNRFSRDRSDPVLGPIIQRAADRYGELRRHDFTYAHQVAMTEAVRAILALKL
jgi:hypothetical protein